MGSRLTTNTFIERSRIVHDDKFDYSKVDYKTLPEKVTIICPEHGEFEQAAASHLNGRGCDMCRRKGLKGSGHPRFKSADEMATRIDPILEAGYHADWSTYQGTHKHMTFVCVKHGSWQATPSNVEGRGSRCPRCANGGYKPDQPGLLYYLKITNANEIWWKVGVTNRSISTRFAGLPAGTKVDVIEEHWFEDGAEALRIENEMLEKAHAAGIPNVERIVMGHRRGDTECFTQDIRGL